MPKVLWIAGALVLSAFGAAADQATDRLESDVMMAPFYTGTIYPTPQKATYAQSFAALSSVGILLGDGIKEDDPRVAVLMDRIARHGGKASFVKTPSTPHATLVCIGGGAAADALLDGRRVPERPQGYLIIDRSRRQRSTCSVRKRSRCS